MSGLTNPIPRPPASRLRRSGVGAPEIVRAALIGALTALGACAQTGDFGRGAPSAWNGLLAGTGSVVAGLRDEPVSGFPLTDDERELRDRAWRFLMPSADQSMFERMLANMVRTRILPVGWELSDPAGYYDGLMSGPFRSPVSRYRRLLDDVVADGRLIPVFASMADRVVSADGVRLRSLPYIDLLEKDDIRDAAMRVAENRCLIAWVRHAAGTRSASYRYALQHLLVAAPVSDAVATERALAFLDERRGALEGIVPPGSGMACLPARQPQPSSGAAPIVAKG